MCVDLAVLQIVDQICGISQKETVSASFEIVGGFFRCHIRPGLRPEIHFHLHGNRRAGYSRNALPLCKDPGMHMAAAQPYIAVAS